MSYIEELLPNGIRQTSSIALESAVQVACAEVDKLRADLAAAQHLLETDKHIWSENVELRTQRDDAVTSRDFFRLELKTAEDLLAAAQARLGEAEKDERMDDQVLKERDDAEEFASHLYYLITGRSPEWSNHFGYEEATEDIDDAQTVLRESLKTAEADLTACEKLVAAKDEALRKIAEKYEAAVKPFVTKDDVNRMCGFIPIGGMARVALALTPADLRDRVLVDAKEANLWGWIAENVGRIDFYAKVPEGCFATNPFIAVGSNFKDAVVLAKNQLTRLTSLLDGKSSS